MNDSKEIEMLTNFVESLKQIREISFSHEMDFKKEALRSFSFENNIDVLKTALMKRDVEIFKKLHQQILVYEEFKKNKEHSPISFHVTRLSWANETLKILGIS